LNVLMDCPGAEQSVSSWCTLPPCSGEFSLNTMRMTSETIPSRRFISDSNTLLNCLFALTNLRTHALAHISHEKRNNMAATVISRESKSFLVGTLDQVERTLTVGTEEQSDTHLREGSRFSSADILLRFSSIHESSCTDSGGWSCRCLKQFVDLCWVMRPDQQWRSWCKLKVVFLLCELPSGSGMFGVFSVRSLIIGRSLIVLISLIVASFWSSHLSDRRDLTDLCALSLAKQHSQ
jgi:hypothetical protein